MVAPPDRALERMTDADVPAVLALERASPEGSAWDEAQLRDELARNWAHLWVMRGVARGVTRVPNDDGGGVVAFIATWLVQDELHVLNVATDPAHRRRGHARALLRHALSFGVEHGVRLVLLEVRRSNAAAIALYRALGFSATNVRARYYADGEDAVEMSLRIDPATGSTLPGRDEVRI